MTKRAIVTVQIKREPDVVTARQRARAVAALVGFDATEQTRIATAVSEIARNAFIYAGGGRVEFSVEGQTAPQVLLVRVADNGPGIRNLTRILEGRYVSSTGMGLGITGARRLMDSFHIESGEGGTTVSLRKILPDSAAFIDAKRMGEIAAALVRQSADDPLAEVQRQNQELLQTLEALRERQDELLRLNRELEDTNRGVVALYAELDEKAESLRRADLTKTRFLSNMSHEFRTPLNAQLALTRLLLERVDGDLNSEQEKQVRLVRQAAESLLELVNDLLDIAKIEAGKIVVRPTEFEVANLFSALRGMLRPILVSDRIDLVFEDPDGIPTFFTDEGKVSQILRNFLSNSIKFTEHGEIRVSAWFDGERNMVTFAVSDTGIGIAPEDQALIFEEFAQIENPLQKNVKGTGLGLPLCKKLAEILGGGVGVESTPGVGSTFTVEIPLHFAPHAETAPEVVLEGEIDARKPLVLVVEDNLEQRFIYQRYFAGTEFQTIFARSLREARQNLSRYSPHAVVLDILLRGEDSWHFLAELKRDPETRPVPVVVVTTVEDEPKGMGLGADAFFIKPVDRDLLLNALRGLIRSSRKRCVLVVDDEETMHYLYRKMIDEERFEIIEAGGGLDGLRLAREVKPDLICLDLAMPDLDGAEVLLRLKADSETAGIPVVVVTSKSLDGGAEVLENCAAWLSKSELSREMLGQTFEGILGNEL